MANSRSSTKTAALRGSTRTGGAMVPTVNAESKREAFFRCEEISSNLHGLLTCMLVVADSHEGGPVTREEKEGALSWLEYEAFKMSRELRKVFS
jgi:hypothetical protein